MTGPLRFARTRVRWFFFLIALAVAIALPRKGCAESKQDVVWSGLVYATNAEHPAATPKGLAGFSQKLKSVFGYNQLELLSEHREVMDDQRERWLLPGKDFCLSVGSKAAPNREYLLNLQLYQQKRLLVETQAKLARQSPIFFRGPLYGDGQLIIVVVVE